MSSRTKGAYVLEKPGRLSIPAIKYVWWSPEQEEYGSKTLPAVMFEVAAVPGPPSAGGAVRRRDSWPVWLLAGLTLCSVAIWQRHRLVALFDRFRRRLHHPERVAARRLLRACRRDDAEAAAAAWLAWENTQPPGSRPSPRLRSTTAELYRLLYGYAGESTWTGRELETAFREHAARNRSSRRSRPVALAPLNPRAPLQRGL